MNTSDVTTMQGAIDSATTTMKQFFNPKQDADKQIPLKLLENAHGLAFLTVAKAGFIWTGKVGTGLVISKLPDGRWSAPSGIGTMGMGFGAEIGAQLIQFMIILSSEAAVKAFMQKGQLSGGVNMEFAAGIYGRAAGANASITKNGVAPNYTYSHSKGLFGGVGLQGSAIATRSDLNKQFYGREITAQEILSGGVDQPAAARALYEAIETAFQVYSRERQMDAMPPAATGSDIDVVFDKVIALVRGFVAGEAVVEDFKQQCKAFGQNECTGAAFIAFLRVQFTTSQLNQLLPDLVRLLSNEDKRRDVWEFYTQIRKENADKRRSSSSTEARPSLFG